MGVLITLNETTVINDGNNSSYTYTFPNGGYTFKDDMIALSSFSNYFSTINISSALGNNIIAFGWPTGDGGVFSVPNIIPDGNYSVASLNAFLQSRMVAGGYYLISQTKPYANVYFINLSLNEALNRVVINTYNLSTTKYTIGYGAFYRYPPNANWVLSNQSPIFDMIPQINQTLGWGNFVGGLPADLNAPDSVFIAPSSPSLLPLKTVNINCSIVSNRTSIPADLLYAYAPNKDETTLSLYTPQADFVWVPILDGTYNDFKIELRNALDNTIITQSNPQMTLVLYIKNKNEFSEINI